jgi:hypothetical protein
MTVGRPGRPPTTHAHGPRALSILSSSTEKGRAKIGTARMQLIIAFNLLACSCPRLPSPPFLISFFHSIVASPISSMQRDRRKPKKAQLARTTGPHPQDHHTTCVLSLSLCMHAMRPSKHGGIGGRSECCRVMSCMAPLPTFLAERHRTTI